MAKLFLHIGMHKTGTTAIQNMLASNVEALSALQLCYSTVGRSGPGHAGWVNCVDFDRREKAIAELMCGYRKEKSIYCAEASLESLLYSINGEVKAQPEFEFILSSECFSEWVEPELYAKELASIFSEIEVIIYLREPESWLKSLTNQYHKDPYFRFSGDILKTPFRELLDYASFIRQWSEAFDSHRVTVRHFDTSPHFDVLRDFLIGALGLAPTALKRFNWSGHDSNLSVDNSMLAALKHYNRYTYDAETHNKLKSMLLVLREQSAGWTSPISDLSEEIPGHWADNIRKYNDALWQELNIETPWW